MKYSCTKSTNKSIIRQSDNPFNINRLNPFWKDDNKLLSKSDIIYNTTRYETFLDSKNIQYDDLSFIKSIVSDRVIIAGGAITSLLSDTKVNDYDMFFKSANDFTDTYRRLLIEGFVCDDNMNIRFIQRDPYINMTCGDIKVQLIKLYWFTGVNQVLDSFDLKLTQFAIQGDMLIYNPDALWDVINKRITIHQVSNIKKIFKRIQKYTERGFTIDPSIYSDILSDVTIENDTNDDQYDNYVTNIVERTVIEEGNALVTDYNLDDFFSVN